MTTRERRYMLFHKALRNKRNEARKMWNNKFMDLFIMGFFDNRTDRINKKFIA